MPLILGTNSIKDTGYDVANSLRFNDDSSDYLSKTQVTATSRRKFTLSTWLKRGNLTGSFQFFLSSYISSNDRIGFYFNSDDTLAVFARNSSGTTLSRQTTAKYRDTSAWYHVVYKIDTTDGNASDRAKMYVNGEQITSFQATGDPSQNHDLELGTSSYNLYVGGYDTSQYFYDGYMAETVFLDGADHDANFFGEFDSDSPTIWKPKDVSGLTFGNNGFYLDFENSGSLGADVSGNSNNFTVNNLTSVDQSTDTCTNNFATWNPLDNFYFQANYFKDGNLHIRSDGSSYSFIRATFGVSTGKWYWEVEYDAQQIGAYSIIGIESKAPTSSTQGVGDTTNGYGYYANDGGAGRVRTNNGNYSPWTSDSYAVGDVVGVYLDLDNNKLYFSKNGTILNSGTGVSITAPSSTDTGFYFPAVTFYDSTGKGTFKANFGSPMESISSGNTDANGYGNFEYSPNDGGSASFDSSAKNFYALNTKNLAEFG